MCCIISNYFQYTINKYWGIEVIICNIFFVMVENLLIAIKEEYSSNVLYIEIVACLGQAVIGA